LRVLHSLEDVAPAQLRAWHAPTEYRA